MLLGKGLTFSENVVNGILLVGVKKLSLCGERLTIFHFQGKGEMMTWWLNGIDPLFVRDTPKKRIDSNRNVNEISVMESKPKLDDNNKSDTHLNKTPIVDMATKQNKQNDALCAELKEAFQKQKRTKDLKDFPEFQDSDYLFTPVEITSTGDSFKLKCGFENSAIVEIEPVPIKAELEAIENYISSVEDNEFVNAFVNQMTDECKLERSDSHRGHLPIDRHKLDTNILDIPLTVPVTNTHNNLITVNENVDLL